MSVFEALAGFWFLALIAPTEEILYFERLTLAFHSRLIILFEVDQGRQCHRSSGNVAF